MFFLFNPFSILYFFFLAKTSSRFGIGRRISRLRSTNFVSLYVTFPLGLSRCNHTDTIRWSPLSTLNFCKLEKAMATHSSTLAWKIPWTKEPGGLQSMGSLRVGHDWATSLSLFTFLHWRRKWQPTPVFLPGESQGRGSLMGWRLWGHTESDTTEVT